MSREIFEKTGRDDFSIFDIHGDPIKPEVAETAMRDLEASVAHLVKSGRLNKNDFQTVFDLFASAIDSFRNGVTYENMVKAMQKGFTRGLEEKG